MAVSRAAYAGGMCNRLAYIGIISIGGAVAAGGCAARMRHAARAAVNRSGVECAAAQTAAFRRHAPNRSHGRRRHPDAARSRIPLARRRSLPACDGFCRGVCPGDDLHETRCDPIPGQFVETITVAGTPGQVHAWQYVDDVAILDAAAAPSYRGLAARTARSASRLLPASVGVLDAAIAGPRRRRVRLRLTCPHRRCRASRST